MHFIDGSAILWGFENRYPWVHSGQDRQGLFNVPRYPAQEMNDGLRFVGLCISTQQKEPALYTALVVFPEDGFSDESRTPGAIRMNAYVAGFLKNRLAPLGCAEWSIGCIPDVKIVENIQENPLLMLAIIDFDDCVTFTPEAVERKSPLPDR
ncbi:hypothetical protein [Dechloromonas sp. A34]|uniref:hypothetical protein n=1 Tax=Dechloromonas sp. A34 TaxID=447588 RepID=UPI0022497EFB|nr:hypothetical protein [Dechloromonas sp. A34]